MDRFSAHIDRSWDLISRGENTPALLAARKALELDRKNPEVHNLIGYIHALDGEFDEALESYRRAIDLDEWYLDPILNAAELLAHPDADPEEAIRLCRRASEMELSSDEQADAALIEIEALFNSGRDAEVRERLDAIADVDALPPAYLAAIGRAYYDVGDLERARGNAEAALGVDGELVDAWYCVGLVAREEGRRVDAVCAFLRVRALDLELPRLPWGASCPEETAAAVAEAIAGLPEEQRRLVEGVEVRVAPYPDEAQIRGEVDPRQIVLAEGVDATRRSYERLWVFSLNLERTAEPTGMREELRRAIAYEIGEPCREP
ncbi:MAG: tetratricopeptide repeat protein [Proteobacteria bacterium]|jgi:tetratricopeptide (TPR) repeat protein|nr:tetratricopeptide repeat protein [Pseudomonadota bacterium]